MIFKFIIALLLRDLKEASDLCCMYKREVLDDFSSKVRGAYAKNEHDTAKIPR